MAFNLKEYILFRTEVNRELFNAEVDTNFRMVANPWVEERIYEEGHIVYHPVVVESDGGDIGAILQEDAPAEVIQPTGTEEKSLGWWRANTRTTKGVFLLDEWDLIGGLGTGDISVRGADGFGRILVNYTGATGPYQTGNDVLLRSPNPDATLNYVAGAGIQLQHDVTTNTLKFVNTGALGEINNGVNIGIGGQEVYAGMSGTDLQFKGFEARNNSINSVLQVATNLGTNNIEYEFNAGLLNLSELSGGAPTADELIDITYPSGMPANGDLLQWDSSLMSFVPVPFTSFGINNIYTASDTITSANRVVNLDGGNSSNLTFRGNAGGFRIDNRPTGTNTFRLGANIGVTTTSRLFDIIAEDINDTQVSITNQNAAGNSVLNFSNTGGAFDFNIGLDIATNSFGIRTSGLGGPGNDALNIDSSGDLFVRQLGAGVYIGGNGNEHFLPFAENQTQALDATGKFRKSTDVTYSYDGTNGQGSRAGQFQINSLNDLFNSEYQTDGYKAGAWIRNIPQDQKTVTTRGPFDYGIYSQVRQALDSETSGLGLISKKVVGIHNDLIERATGKVGTVENGISLSEMNILNKDTTSTGDKIYLAGYRSNFYSYSRDAQNLFNFLGVNSTDSSSVPAAPIREEYGFATIWTTGSNATSTIGIFADVVNSYTNEFEIDENLETWAGLFRGCIAVKQGGIVLEESASVPVCNTVTPTGEIPYEDKTLWINESTGHLMRGTSDVEDNFKYVLASSQFRVTTNTSFAVTAYSSIPTDFSLAGNSLVNQAGWNEPNWTTAYTISINNSAGSLGSIEFERTGCLIAVPYNLVIGQKVKLTAMCRFIINSGTPTESFRGAILHLDQDDFFDTTGGDTTIEMLESAEVAPSVTDGTVGIYKLTIDHTLTKNVNAGDFLSVGFGYTDMGASDNISVTWSLSCSDS